MVQQILTHPGGAHKDDFLATAVMISAHGAPVSRRDPTPAELADPAVCILDIGGEHAPERMNFDHHQFPRDSAPTCALSLVLQHLGVYDDARLFCDWLETTERIDTQGPNKTADWLGADRGVMAKLNSPIDISLIRRFALANELETGAPLYEIMRIVGEDLLAFLKEVRERIDFVAANAQIWELEKGSDTIQALFLPRTDPLPDEPSAAIGRYIRSIGLDGSMAAIVYPDRRGEGYGVARHNDHPRLDFTRIAEADDVHFAHNSGFLCKTSATDSSRLKEQILQAWK